MVRKLLGIGAVLLGLTSAASAQYYYTSPAPAVVYSQPTYAAPVYATPTYAAPVYAAPVYAAPVYAPYYGYGGYGYGGGYYSPLSVGLNFGFGGRGGRWR